MGDGRAGSSNDGGKGCASNFRVTIAACRAGCSAWEPTCGRDWAWRLKASASASRSGDSCRNCLALRDLLNFRQDLFCPLSEGTGGLEFHDLIKGGPGCGELLEAEITHTQIKENFGVGRLFV